MQRRDTPAWMLLRGEAYLADSAYQNAVQYLRRAEEAYPQEVIPKLEACYRELGDYKQAYLYACKQKPSWERRILPSFPFFLGPKLAY